ncbi:MAG TPA: tetratricopeptide repeat protein [Gaiellaceae bacterium]|nr:tetratricopeptide repeat protein [Gaiellaceae bacterium]
MSAAAHIPEEPSFTGEAGSLTVLPGWDVEQRLLAAERLTEYNQHETALEQLEELLPLTRRFPVLAVRHRLATAWAEMYSGHLDEAADLLAHADTIVQSPLFDAADRAEVLFRSGCVALKRTDVAEATSLFTRALETNARSAQASTVLAANVLNWRSRCHQLRRDFDAAARDAESSLALALDAGDDRARANALFQSSLVAERQRQWLLARFFAEQALELYREQGDTLSTARMLNNLGGIEFLLGDVAAAERTLAEAAATAGEAGSAADVAQATSSLAQVLLGSDRPGEARTHALGAIELLTGRTDFVDELGNAQLVVARSFAAEGDTKAATEWLGRAEQTFAAPGSASPLAAVWIARGDLARSTGELEAAAELYRRAADALQDFHF